jgi:hypothetical protein
MNCTQTTCLSMTRESLPRQAKVGAKYEGMTDTRDGTDLCDPTYVPPYIRRKRAAVIARRRQTQRTKRRLWEKRLTPKQRRRRLRTRAQVVRFEVWNGMRTKTLGGLFKDQLYKKTDGGIGAISRLKAYQRNPVMWAKTQALKKAYAEAPNRGFIPAQRSQSGRTVTVTVCPPTSAPSQTAHPWTSWFSGWRGSTPSTK